MSISGVSAEDSADAVVLDDTGGDIELNEVNSDLEFSNSDSTPEDLSVDDTEDVDLEATDTDSIKTEDIVSSDVEIQDDNIDDADPILNVESKSKQKNILSSSGTSYYNVYVDSVTSRFGSTNYIYFGWQGYFRGYFKIYDSDWDCVHSEYIYGTDKDFKWNLENLDVDKYTAVLVGADNSLVDYGTIKITKSYSKISIKTVKTKNGIIYFYAYVKDKFEGFNYNGGKVKFRINGKNYYAPLKNGVAILKFKVPKKVKTYTCKVTDLGGSNVYSSSKTFKFTVKKHKYYVYKLKTKYKTFYIGKCGGIRGVMLKPFQKKGWYLVKGWYGKKRYNMGAAGIYWDLYGKFKKRYWVKKAKYRYY